MPTAAELQKYVKSLPQLYRDILTAYPAIDPARKAGYWLAFPTLAAYFANRKIGHAIHEIQEARQRLAEKGFVEIRNGIFAHPTELREQLIAAASGKRATALTIPELPTPTW